MKTGIFGGTFNPPHKGHRRALEAFIKEAELERVLVIPTYIPPHKNQGDKWAEFDDRMAMCTLAFDGIEGVVFSDIEKRLFEKNGGKSYTHLTLKELFLEGEEELSLFVGTDMFLTLDTWREAEYILKNAEICVMARGEENDGDILNFKKKLEEQFEVKKITVINDEALAASSTDVRGGAYTLLDSKTRSYIKKRGLYS